MLYSFISNIRKQLALLFLFFISALFAYKYIFERFQYPNLFFFTYIFGIIAIIIFLFRTKAPIFRSSSTFFITIGVFSLISIAIFYIIKPELLSVDRWKMISNFWEFALKGEYPYNRHSPEENYPGPMPVYFLLTFPFYLVNEIGYFSLVGIIIFSLFIRKKMTSENSYIALILMLSSLGVIWEICTRSTIITNTILFLIYFNWLINADLNNNKTCWYTAIIGGLILSTRNVFAVILFIYLIYALKNRIYSFKKLLYWGLILTFTFIITFSPFLLFFSNQFLKINPFYTQSEFLLPFGFHIAFVILAIIMGYLCKSKNNLIWESGLILFIIFLLYSIFLINKFGFIDAYFNSRIDLSYSLFCFPFFIYFVFMRE